MSHKIYIGIDNGVTGTIGWVGENLCPGIEETPVNECKNVCETVHALWKANGEVND